jgi:replicative DNA helicase
MNLQDLPFDALPDEQPQDKLRSEVAETAVLSILMAYPDAYDAVAESLQPALFTGPNNRAMFAVIRREIAAAKHPDVVTVSEALGGRMTIQEVHAVAISHDHSARGIKGMVDLLVERHKSRELHRIAAKLSEAAFDTDKPAQQRIDVALADLQKLEEVSAADDWVDAEEAAATRMDTLSGRFEIFQGIVKRSFQGFIIDVRVGFVAIKGGNSLSTGGSDTTPSVLNRLVIFDVRIGCD